MGEAKQTGMCSCGAPDASGDVEAMRIVEARRADVEQRIRTLIMGRHPVPDALDEARRHAEATPCRACVWKAEAERAEARSEAHERAMRRLDNELHWERSYRQAAGARFVRELLSLLHMHDDAREEVLLRLARGAQVLARVDSMNQAHDELQEALARDSR